MVLQRGRRRGGSVGVLQLVCIRRKCHQTRILASRSNRRAHEAGRGDRALVIGQRRRPRGQHARGPSRHASSASKMRAVGDEGR